MGFLQRLFGVKQPENAPTGGTPASGGGLGAQVGATTQQVAPQGTGSIPPERVGLNGEYDQSGLAKRVALAFDQNPEIDDIDTVYVAQRGDTVVLKGKVPNQTILQKLTAVAKNVHGATGGVETDEVAIG
jgi:hypothetical protein